MQGMTKQKLSYSFEYFKVLSLTHNPRLQNGVIPPLKFHPAWKIFIIPHPTSSLVPHWANPKVNHHVTVAKYAKNDNVQNISHENSAFTR